MRTGAMRVLGATLGPGGLTAAAVVTDGAALHALGEAAVRPLPSGAEPAMVETALAELLARFAPAGLIGLTGLPEGVSGAILAEALETTVVWQLDAADRAMGGQGGPLEPFFWHALARLRGWRRPVAVLDLGTLVRLIWLDPSDPRPESACLAFDAGPGAPAARGGGQADDAILQAYVRHPYFARRPPKWCAADPPLPMTAHLAPADAAATLAACSAAAVTLACEHLPCPPERLIATGPGRRDAALLALVAAGCDLPVVPAETLGIDPDPIGAQTAAHLAARARQGLPTTAPATTGARVAVGGGVISRPGTALLGG